MVALVRLMGEIGYNVLNISQVPMHTYTRYR